MHIKQFRVFMNVLLYWTFNGRTEISQILLQISLFEFRRSSGFRRTLGRVKDKMLFL